MSSNFFLSGPGIIMEVVFLAAGVWVIIATRRNLKKGEASLSWPTTTGTITRTWVEESYTEDDDGWKDYSYSPRWEYQYAYLGQTYSSNRLTYGATKAYNSESQAVEALHDFPQNSQVTVYYDPNAPEDSVLIPGAEGTIIGYFLGGIFVVISVIMFAIGILKVIQK
jgi:hypothetical protein